MYIQTPKRYRGIQRRRVFSCGRLFFSLILLLLIFIFIGIYRNPGFIQPAADRIISTAVHDIQSFSQTQLAPPPTPTQDPSINLVNGDNAWQRGHISDAITFYEQILGSVPNDVRVYQRITFGNLSRGAVDIARDYAERTVTADPFNPDAWATRSLAMSWQGSYEQGIASALQALDFDEEHATAIAYLAYSYWGADQTQLAESRADEAIRLAPDLWAGYWVRGLIRENTLLDIAGARSDFETAYQLTLEQNPAFSGVAAAGVARVLVRPEYLNYDEAVALLEQVRSNDPENREALYTLGLVQYAYRGDYGQAQGPLEDCTQIAPDDYECQYLLGRTQERLGNTEAALVAFEAAIDSGSPLARHYWWAANMEIALGSCANATPLLETGFRMVTPGDLPADDEGNETLISDFSALMTTCRVSTSTFPESLSAPTAEATEDSP